MGYYVGPEKPLVSDSEDRKVYIAAAGQTSFASTYTVGYVDVFVNGQKIIPLTDFTATDGSTVVLTEACSLGDEVEIIARISSKPYDYYLKSQVDAKIPAYGVGIGSGDAMSVTTTPAITGLVDGQEIKIRVPSANTSATPSITFSTLGISKTLTKFGNQPLQANDLNAGQEITVRYSSATDKLEIVSLIRIINGDVGDVKYVAAPTAPLGWLVANGSAISRTAYAELFKRLVTDLGYTSQTFTVTIAANAVFTKTGHGFTGGERLRLSTTGALPTGLNTSTDYFVIYIDANTFRLSSDPGATTGITTSGAQSGTHSYVQSLYGLGDGSTTFNIPDLRGEFPRGADLGRGVDGNRVLGSAQRDALQGHMHNQTAGSGTGVSGSYGRYADGSGNFFTSNYTLGPSTDGINGVPRVAAETRPRNVSLLPVIKY